MGLQSFSGLMYMKSIETDVLVIGESAGGVVAAVRSAREGLTVHLVTYKDNIGGVMPSLGAIETHYSGVRTPMLTEIRERIFNAYRSRYGEDSPQFATCTSLESNNPMVTYEPHVLETIFDEMLTEAGVIIHTCYRPETVHRSDNILRTVVLRSCDSDHQLQISASVFIDCTYEGDVMALAGVPYRYGREGRNEYHELHAGRLFTRWDFSGQKYPLEAAGGILNIMPKFSTMGIYSGSTGEGDNRIQAYSYRLCLTNTPDNRLILNDPPPNYQRENFLAITLSPQEIGTTPYALHHRFLNNTLENMIKQDHIFHGHALPNNKRSWNATNYPGGNHEYLQSDDDAREDIAKHHLNHALAILYFLQNDASVPPSIRKEAREWGLAKDEFLNNHHIPPQLYVREGRRMLGRKTFTQNDNMVASGISRSPIHADSIGITEFPIDSLACSTERMPGTLCDGQFFLMELSRPGQIPFSIMLPDKVDNLIVPIATSSTHVAWGTVRQTPTLIHISESAAVASTLAIKMGINVSELNVDLLQHKLLEADIMISFFNDVDMSVSEPFRSAVQYFGTKGLFTTYDAHLDHPLDATTANQWVSAVATLLDNTLKPMNHARQLHRMESSKQLVTTHELHKALKRNNKELLLPVTEAYHDDHPLLRGEACTLLYQFVYQQHVAET